MRLRSAQERELCRAGWRGELPGAHGGPLPGLPARLPATSDVSIPGDGSPGPSGWDVRRTSSSTYLNKRHAWKQNI